MLASHCNPGQTFCIHPQSETWLFWVHKSAYSLKTAHVGLVGPDLGIAETAWEFRSGTGEEKPPLPWSLVVTWLWKMVLWTETPCIFQSSCHWLQMKHSPGFSTEAYLHMKWGTLPMSTGLERSTYSMFFTCSFVQRLQKHGGNLLHHLISW